MRLFPFDRDPLSPLADELDEWRVALDYRGPLPRTWAGRLRRDLEAEAVAASTSMEGIPVTAEEVRRILAGDTPKETRRDDADLVRGYHDAMGFVLRRADDPNFRWDRELLVALHDRILAGKFGLGAGRLREGPAYVVNSSTGEQVFLPPPPEEVARLVDDACDQMRRDESKLPPAVNAAWFHVAVAAIHPFRDGNGRVARVVASLAMYRGGFKLPEFTSLEEWWGRHIDHYYGAFGCLGAEFDATRDVTAFITSHMQAQLHQVRALDLREQVQGRIWSAIEESVVQVGQPPRLANAVWDCFFGREVTSRYYRPLADVGPATAAGDLSAAVAAGLLRPQGDGRARRYVAGDDLYGTVGRALDIDVRDWGESGRSVIIGALTERVNVSSGRSRLREKMDEPNSG